MWMDWLLCCHAPATRGDGRDPDPEFARMRYVVVKAAATARPSPIVEVDPSASSARSA